MYNKMDISKLKYAIRDKMYSNDNNISIKAIDKKALKLINENLSIIVYDYITDYLKSKQYTDLHYNDITIKVKSTIDANTNLFNYDIIINNEHMYVSNKEAITQEIYNKMALIEYDIEFITIVNKEFTKLVV